MKSREPLENTQMLVSCSARTFALCLIQIHKCKSSLKKYRTYAIPCSPDTEFQWHCVNPFVLVVGALRTIHQKNNVEILPRRKHLKSSKLLEPYPPLLFMITLLSIPPSLATTLLFFCFPVSPNRKHPARFWTLKGDLIVFFLVQKSDHHQSTYRVPSFHHQMLFVLSLYTDPADSVTHNHFHPGMMRNTMHDLSIKSFRERNLTAMWISKNNKKQTILRSV